MIFGVCLTNVGLDRRVAAFESKSALFGEFMIDVGSDAMNDLAQFFVTAFLGGLEPVANVLTHSKHGERGRRRVAAGRSLQRGPDWVRRASFDGRHARWYQSRCFVPNRRMAGGQTSVCFAAEDVRARVVRRLHGRLLSTGER